MKWEPVLKRIKKANDFIRRYPEREDLQEAAKSKFEKEIIPEAVAVGIDEPFAWGLFYFGDEFLKYELEARKPIDPINF